MINYNNYSYSRQQKISINLQNLLTKITSRNGFNPRINGSNYLVGCPAHDDRSPSLSVTERDNKILLKCFTGCSIQEICDALDIKVSDLFLNKKRGAF